ncbi:hypothetical protein [Radiobacillus deserti]|uniref:Uncharacterized protein n=1 Tax=Radiobacillus deserti TaxID=2594883 RepID=A0A516KIF5_9BACI|nr:hypothetical protein [Radiobacillus deserti]QDP41180.1 hypothetical protein FN924_13880 [Radiobacillus deserti]
MYNDKSIAQLQKNIAGPEDVDSDSLLILIHALKNEEARSNWIKKHAGDSVYNKLHSYTAQLEMDKEMPTWTSKMKRFIQEGKAPNDPEVLKHTEAMVEIMKSKVVPLLNDETKKQLLGDETKEQYDNNDDSYKDPNPYLFPSAFNKEEEKFMEKVVEELINKK